LINSPFDDGQDWEIIKKELRSNIIKKINSTLKVDIENNIIKETVAVRSICLYYGSNGW